MNIFEFQNKIHTKVSVWTGRFQPFHKGHYFGYLTMLERFGYNNTYIATSNAVDLDTSPFNFIEKKQIIVTMFNIPEDRIVMVKSPYHPTELLERFPDESTAYVTGFSKKDRDRFHGSTYFIEYEDNLPLKPYPKHGYYVKIPVYKMDVDGKNISGTQIRETFRNASMKQKKALFIHLYDKYDDKIFNLFLEKLDHP